MLPDRLQKRKWNAASCTWQAKLGALQTGKNYLLAILSFDHGAEGAGETSPSCAAQNTAIGASSSSQGALITT